MAVENFEQVLRALRSSGNQPPAGHPGAGSNQKGERQETPAPLSADGLPQDAIEAIRNYQEDWRVFNEQLCEKLKDDVQRYLANQDLPDFQDRMGGRREEVKMADMKRLDELYDALVESGKAHPEAQKAILEAANSIQDFTAYVVGRQLDFIGELSSSIVEWQGSAIEKIDALCREVDAAIVAFFQNFQ